MKIEIIVFIRFADSFHFDTDPDPFRGNMDLALNGVFSLDDAGEAEQGDQGQARGGREQQQSQGQGCHRYRVTS